MTCWRLAVIEMPEKAMSACLLATAPSMPCQSYGVIL